MDVKQRGGAWQSVLSAALCMIRVLRPAKARKRARGDCTLTRRITAPPPCTPGHLVCTPVNGCRSRVAAGLLLC